MFSFKESGQSQQLQTFDFSLQPSVDPSLELAVLGIFTYISVSEVKIFWKQADQD